jgi:predicted DCC family thiol-disulfide oxidoreductase YuxK
MYPHKQPLILFDGYCHLCSKSVMFVIKRDKKKIFSFIPLQSKEALAIKGWQVHDINIPSSLILFENDKVYQKSGAALRIVRHLKFPWNLFYGLMIVPAFIRDGIYMYISKNRYRWFGKREACHVV